jgi:starch synthase (maltosyl-transferring)
VRTLFSRNDCLHMPLLVLGTNSRGAMLRVSSDWQRLTSRYDAVLAANLNPEYPEDRQIVLTRFRAWIVYQGFSIAVNGDCLERFGFDYARGAFWQYRIPTGQGQHILLHMTLGMETAAANCVRLTAKRLDGDLAADRLADQEAVALIIRPDIEDRNFHHTTKAFAGPEQQFPAAVTSRDDGFDFSPSGNHCLSVRSDAGRFTREPEWYYMVHRHLEAERGLDPDSDLFSPGYFAISLEGEQRVTVTARAFLPEETKGPGLTAPKTAIWMPEKEILSLEEALTAALDHYVVRRGEFRTVIAGYPWFLDWGRDTLIVARGLIAAGKIETVKAILLQFARFEQQGTIPNMIRGSDASNRDTSDAPLWLFTACADLNAAEGRNDFLNSDCDGRTLRRVLIDLAKALIAGTSNGIKLDPASGLLFSPAHFTWMDTNHPAATPRQGYPIEIQALWFAALNYLAAIDDPGRRGWQNLAAQVTDSILQLFWQPDLGYLVDCRHAAPGESAQAARPDDALRPNQLLALTLGAVSDRTIMQAVLRACQSLLVPGAIRTLADRPVRVPLAVHHHGKLLNNPSTPYAGTYGGDEDTRRKPAYHNGTAWSWPFPSFCEAWIRCYGPAEKDTALAWLSSAALLINAHCLGHVPEIVDGDMPHAQRGCDAQAWGASELLRVWKWVQHQQSPLNR